MRPTRDWLAIWAVVLGSLSLVSCTPLLAAASGVMGVVAWRRARAAGRRSRLATASLVITGAAIAAQVALWQVVGDWLIPTMERRTVSALAAACEGRFDAAVPESGVPTLAPTQPAPTPEQVTRFAADLGAAMGGFKSVSVINPEVSGSVLAPTVGMALVAQFEKGSCSGSARVQWVPPRPDDATPWLPTARVIELEFSLPGGRILRMPPETGEGTRP